MKVEDIKHLDPFQTQLILVLDRIARSLELILENDFTSYRKLSIKEYRKLLFHRHRKLMLGLKYFRTYYYNLWD